MITKVVLAKLSPTMEEGTIVTWSKQEGDAVKVGDVLAEIETDKANMEMEALGAGTLRKVLVPAGGKAPVGTLIGVIADEGDEPSGWPLAEVQVEVAAGERREERCHRTEVDRTGREVGDVGVLGSRRVGLQPAELAERREVGAVELAGQVLDGVVDG